LDFFAADVFRAFEASSFSRFGLFEPVEFKPLEEMKRGEASLHVLASVEELAYKALLPPHSQDSSRVRGYMCWGFSGVFWGFASLRFICCLCALSSEEVR
jgi:hypothetical protein